jgi:predicted dehydrogenase
MEAMWMRCHPLLLKVRSLLQSGELGQVRLFMAEFGHPTSFDASNRFFDPRFGGGALLDRGVYPISLAYYLLGPPSEVVGRCTIGPTGVDEQESSLFHYGDGAMAVLASSLRSLLRNEAVIIGTQGQIRIHAPFYAPHRVSWTRFTEPTGAVEAPSLSSTGWKVRLKRNPLLRRAFEMIGRAALSDERRDTFTVNHFGRGHGYEFEAAEVVRCLQEGQLESPIMPLDETLAIMQTIGVLRQSWKSS